MGKENLVAKPLSEDGGKCLLRKALQELSVAEGWEVWGALHSMRHEGRCHHESPSSSCSPDHRRHTALYAALLQQDLQRMPHLHVMKASGRLLGCSLCLRMQLEEEYWCKVHAGNKGHLNRYRAIAGRRANRLPEGSEGQQERARELAKVAPQGSAVGRCRPRSSRRRIARMRVQQPAHREYTLRPVSLPPEINTNTYRQTPVKLIADVCYSQHTCTPT